MNHYLIHDILITVSNKMRRSDVVMAECATDLGIIASTHIKMIMDAMTSISNEKKRVIETSSSRFVKLILTSHTDCSNRNYYFHMVIMTIDFTEGKITIHSSLNTAK
jgi:hypothetical protein